MGYSDHFNVTAGYGDLATQRLNAYAMVDYQQFGGIKARDRSFADTLYIPGQNFGSNQQQQLPGQRGHTEGHSRPDRQSWQRLPESDLRAAALVSNQWVAAAVPLRSCPVLRCHQPE
jgi:hypothetical protein